MLAVDFTYSFIRRETRFYLLSFRSGGFKRELVVSLASLFALRAKEKVLSQKNYLHIYTHTHAHTSRVCVCVCIYVQTDRQIHKCIKNF